MCRGRRWSSLRGQLGIADASCVKKYVGRTQTPYEHAWEIRERRGYRSFDDAESAASFARFLDGRACPTVFVMFVGTRGSQP